MNIYEVKILIKFEPNSDVKGGGAGGRVPPYIFHREIFADLPGKNGQGRRGNAGEKNKYLKRKTWKIENGRENYEKWKKWAEDLFFFFSSSFFFLFFFFFFFFFGLSLFETTEIFKNLFGVYQNGQFLPGKSIFHWEKWLCPLWKIFLLRHLTLC